MLMSKADDIGGVILGVLGGLALAEIIRSLMQKKCPYCQNLNESNRTNCKYCGGRLN